LIVLAFVALTVAMTWPWARMIRDAVPDPGDAYLNSWFLWWAYYQTFQDPLNLFQAPILFPSRDTLAFSENNYGISLLFFPLFALGLRPITVQGVAALVGFILSGYGAFRLTRTLSGSHGAAWVAGIAFGFATYRFHQLGHLGYMFSGWIPLLLEALVLFTRQRTWRRASWLGIAFAMNALTCIHWFVLTLIPLGLSAVFLLTRHRLWRDRDVWIRGGVGMAAAGLVLLPFLVPYLRVAYVHGMTRTSRESALYSARVGNWLSADPSNKLWHGFGPWAEAGERALFPGMLPIFLLIAAFYFSPPVRGSSSATLDPEPPRSNMLVSALDLCALVCLLAAGLVFGYAPSGVRVLGLTALHMTDPRTPLALCLVALSIRLYLALPRVWRPTGDRHALDTVALGLIWTVVGFCGSLGMNFVFHRFLFEHVFLFRSVRVPARWGMLACLGIALLAGLGAARLVAALRRRRPTLRPLPVYMILCGLLLFELRAAPLALVHAEVDPDALTLYFRQTPMRGGIVHLPSGGEEGNYRYVLRQADHHRPLVTAVSGFSTPLLTEIESLSRTQPIPDRFLDVLEKTPVSYLAVHRPQLRPEHRIAVDYMLARAISAGRLRYIRSFAGTGIHGNQGADLYAVVTTEPAARTEAALPFALPVREWDVLIARDPINVLGRYQALSQAVYRFSVASYGQMPRYADFLLDLQAIARGMMIDAPDDPAAREDRLRQSADRWVERARFKARYHGAGDTAYVVELTRNAGIVLDDAERTALIDRLERGAVTRARVLLDIVNSKAFVDAEETRSLVLLHFFAYLRRNPDDPPDGDWRGFHFWLREVEQSRDMSRLTRAFAASIEYQNRGGR
jgi:hypothetical protein